MNDLDTMLLRLASAPVPDGLNGMEARVRARITAQSGARVGVGFGAMTIGAALVLGVIGAGLPSSEVRAMSPLTYLGQVSSLAPSTLLVGEP